MILSFALLRRAPGEQCWIRDAILYQYQRTNMISSSTLLSALIQRICSDKSEMTLMANKILQDNFRYKAEDYERF